MYQLLHIYVVSIWLYVYQGKAFRNLVNPEFSSLYQFVVEIRQLFVQKKDPNHPLKGPVAAFSWAFTATAACRKSLSSRNLKKRRFWEKVWGYVRYLISTFKFGHVTSWPFLQKDIFTFLKHWDSLTFALLGAWKAQRLSLDRQSFLWRNRDFAKHQRRGVLGEMEPNLKKNMLCNLS